MAAASPTRSTTSDEDDPPPSASPTTVLTTAVTNLLRSLIAPLLTPLYSILSFLSSPAFLRASISALVFLGVSALLLALSTTGYLVFYYNYIPPINLAIPLYLQYGGGAVGQQQPYAVAEIPMGTLVGQQAYEVAVQLEMPRTPANVEVGVFMVDVRLLGAFNPLVEPPESLRALVGNVSSALGGGGGGLGAGYSVLQHARRPAMLRYRSRSLGLVHKALNLPWHVLGLRDLDTEKVGVRMWEKVAFKRGLGNVPRSVRLEVAAGGAATTGFRQLAAGQQVQVYTASVTFSARFHGLRYLVYNHRILSFVVFSTVFYVVSIISMGLVWAWIGPSIMAPPPGSNKAAIKQEEDEPASQMASKEIKGEKDPGIKTEDEDEENYTQQGLKLEDVSDTPVQFPSGRGRTPLRYEGRSDERGAGAAAQAQEREIGEGEKADDEDEEEGEFVDDDAAMYERAYARATGRFEGDSGIGTMSESTRTGSGSGHGRGHDLVRRRSGRGAGGKQ